VESCELTEVEACNSLNSVVWREQALVGDDLHQMEVVLLVKEDAVFLPELLGMTWTPSKLSSSHLVSELLDGTVNLLVVVEVFEKLF